MGNNFTCFGWCPNTSSRDPTEDVYSVEEDGSGGWRHASLINDSDSEDAAMPTFTKTGSVVSTKGTPLNGLSRSDSLSEIEVPDFIKGLRPKTPAVAPPYVLTTRISPQHYPHSIHFRKPNALKERTSIDKPREPISDASPADLEFVLAWFKYDFSSSLSCYHRDTAAPEDIIPLEEIDLSSTAEILSKPSSANTRKTNSIAQTLLQLPKKARTQNQISFGTSVSNQDDEEVDLSII